MRTALIYVFLGIFACISEIQAARRTALDEYVERYDPSYFWEELEAFPGEGYTSYTLNLTSLTWMTTAESNMPLWWHYLLVVIPDDVIYPDAAQLTITNGNMDDAFPTPENDGRFRSAAEYALGTGAVSAQLKMIPNQRLLVPGNPPNRWRREDDLIAWTWRQFIDDPSNPEILMRFPMVKASIRAMDTIAEFAKLKNNDLDIDSFYVSGGSKRGWTTYLVAAVDERVFAISPSVLTCLNFADVMMHQFEAYGAWSFSNYDYYREDLTMELFNPNLDRMMDLIDPYAYRDRITVPKLLISAAGDEHFMPDDSWYFWDDLVGEKFIWMLEDAGHSISNSPHADKIAPNRIAFFHAAKTGFALPHMNWTRSEKKPHDQNAKRTGAITLYTDTEPLEISAVYGDTTDGDRRDFRYRIGIPNPGNPVRNPIEWIEGPVENLGSGAYRAEYEVPDDGWRCFFIKMTYRGPGGREMYFTTEVQIIPDEMPFDKCRTPEECRGSLL